MAKAKKKEKKGFGYLYKRDAAGHEHPATSKVPGRFWLAYRNDEGRRVRVRLEAANAKKSFDQLKTEYEEESKSKKGDLESQRAKAKEIMASVDPALLEEYETIKKHISPPVARLTHGQCAGCNTSLPSAILSKIKSGALVECETCGRMIIP